MNSEWALKKKAFFGGMFSCRKNPVDLDKHERASSVSLSYCAAGLVFGSLAGDEAGAENP